MSEMKIATANEIIKSKHLQDFDLADDDSERFKDLIDRCLNDSTVDTQENSEKKMKIMKIKQAFIVSYFTLGLNLDFRQLDNFTSLLPRDEALWGGFPHARIHADCPVATAEIKEIRNFRS